MSKKRAIIYMILASLFWSIAGLFIKQLAWHPIVIAGIRSLIAGSFMALFLKGTFIQFNKKMWLGAICYVFVAALFVIANKLTTSTNAILLQFTAPIWVLLLNAAIDKKRPPLRDAIVIIIVMLGMVLFFLGDLKAGNITGNILAILAGVALAFMILVMNGKDRVNPLLMTVMGNGLLFVLSLPFIFIYPPSITLSSVSKILVLGIFQLGMGYILFTKSVRYVSSLEASLLMVIEPLLNPLWVLLIIGEKPSIYAVYGGVVVVSAIVWHQLYSAKAPPLGRLPSRFKR